MIRLTVTRICPSRAKLVQYLLDMGWYQKFESESYHIREGFEDYASGKWYVEIPIAESKLEFYVSDIIEALSAYLESDIISVYNEIVSTIV